MTIPMDQIEAIPAFSPYYPRPPARYRNNKSQLVFFRADSAAIDRVLPACFEPTDSGMCLANGISMEWSAHYGKFQACNLFVECLFQGKVGYFCIVSFLNTQCSIPAGREIYGTPKVYADVNVGMAERVMHTEANLSGTAVMSIRSTMHKESSVKDIPQLEHAWMLKVIPRADGKGTDVMQLIDNGNVQSDVTVHICMAGDGVVQFNPSPTYNLFDFAPLEYFGAYYLEKDHTDGFGEIVHDFKKDS